MTFATNSKSADSSSGVATVDISGWFVSKVQVSIHDVTTGTGTVTLTAMPAGTDEFQPITDGTADLSDSGAVLTFTIDGNVSQIKATSSQSGDAFTLLVGA